MIKLIVYGGSKVSEEKSRACHEFPKMIDALF